MERIEIPIFADKKELFAFLLKNKSALIRQKRFSIKEGDLHPFTGGSMFDQKGSAMKAGQQVQPNTGGDVLKVTAVINTTNWMDSHYDVHMPGLWTKSLEETGGFLQHIQEHKGTFDHIISEGTDLKAYTKNFTWKELGFDYPGKTQALVFDSNVRKDRNAYMFDQYSKGYVKNHSVGMGYVKMILCVNEPDDTSYGAEFEAWEKYLPSVVNKERAEEAGFFWAILEAKAFEGSAVPRGSNIVTPTISVKAEPLDDSTHNEPVSATQRLLKTLETKNIF